MSEEIKTGRQLLEQAHALFQKTQYTNASTLFDQAALALPGDTEAPLYALVSRFMAGHRTGPDLKPLWEQAKPMTLAAIGSDAPFPTLEMIRQALSICTAGVYRSCNDRQQLEYAQLNKDVKLENREFIFDEIRRILLEADEEYKVCLTVMYEFSQLVCRTPGQENASESFFLAVLSYIQAAADLQMECSQEDYFSPLDLARFACALSVGEGMSEALKARAEILKTVLTGEAALGCWEEFDEYARAAGITRASIEKKVRRRNFLEKLKFWKRLKKSIQK